jgi:hypothetical protein
MAIVITDNKHYTDIANAIRGYLPSSPRFKPAEMAKAVTDLGSAISRDAYDSGYEFGKEDGKIEEYDRFWDAFQDNGNRTNYESGFRGLGWNDETYNPKYPILGSNGSSAIFNSSRMADIKVSVTVSGSIASLFAYSYVQTVPLLILDGVTNCNQAFQNAKYLENITFYPENSFGINGLDMHWSPLTVDSMLSLFNCLADYSEDTSGATHTVTLGTTNLAKLTDEDKAVATEKGWTLA